jgi:hypothetical protein
MAAQVIVVRRGCHKQPEELRLALLDVVVFALET